MHIDNIEIKGFGKLKNRVFSFRKGMNVVFGDNEAGKSTMQWFIMAMFYGLKGGRSSAAGLPSPLKRFMPWDGEPYGGAVSYTLDKGVSCRIERDFSRNTVVVYDAAYNDITSSFSFGRDKQPMIGETHLGMDETTFENTVFIRQMGVRLDSGSSSMLAARLVNMENPDINGLVFQRAEATLTDALKNRVGTERSRIQPLDRLQSELKKLESEHRALADRQKQKEQLIRELSDIKRELGELEVREQRLAKIGKLIETRKKIDEGLKKETRLIETVKQLGEIEAAIAKLRLHADARTKSIQQPGQIAQQPGIAGTAQQEGYVPEEERRADEGLRMEENRPALSKKPLLSGIAFRIALLVLCAAALPAFVVLMFDPFGIGFGGFGRGTILPYLYIPVMILCGLAGAALFKGILKERRSRREGGESYGIRGTGLSDPRGVTGGNESAAGKGVAAGSRITTGNGMTAGIKAAEDDAAAGAAAEKLAALESVKRNLLSGASMICSVKTGNISDVRAALDDVRSGTERLSRQLQEVLDEAAGADVPLPGFFSQGELDELIYDSDICWLEKGWETEMEGLRRQILDTALREKYCEGQLDDEKGETDRLQHTEEEIAAVKEKVAELENTGKALKLALEVLTGAAEEIRLNNAPELNNRMSAIISGLTGGGYTDLRGDDRLNLKASVPQGGDVKIVSVLSNGTADQMHLALRLATAGMLTSGGESLPLVMDEVFSQFDDKRTELALKYFYREYRNRQILLFTCKKREAELVREIYGDKMNFVEL